MKTTKLLLAIPLLLAGAALACTILVFDTPTPAPVKPLEPATQPSVQQPATQPLPGSPPATSEPVASQPVTPLEDRIGLVQRELDVVQLGKSAASLVNVSDMRDLFAGDVLRIQEGGEGLLDFGSSMRLRLFNDTQVGVTSASAPGTPFDVRLFLEDGGFTGEVIESGGQAVFKTPNNAEITVLGTRFLVAYDSATGTTTAANFDGTVQVSSPAGALDLPPATFTLVVPGRPPDPPRPFVVSMEEYNRLARRLQSPLLALREFGMVDRPPALKLMDVSTDFIDLGSECSGTARSVVFTVWAEDDGGPKDVRVNGFWVLENQRGAVEMERLDDFTFRGEVGNLQQVGTLTIHITAQDASGQGADLDPIQVQVGFCVG